MSEEKDESGAGDGEASKPQSTDDLKRFLNSDPGDLPEAAAHTPEVGPGGADATVNESDVGRGEDDEHLVADQPLAAQQDEDEVPDALQEGEDVDEDGDEIQKESDAAAGNQTD